MIMWLSILHPALFGLIKTLYKIFVCMKKNKIYKIGELFCGPGGLAQGALDAKISKNGTTYKLSHAWASDYSIESCNTFRKNITNGSKCLVICENVHNLKIRELPPIDAFAYGFPCNDFSIIGEKKGFNGEFGPLYSYGVSVINTFKPKFFVAENVGGLIHANEGKAFKKILSDLGNCGNGYELTIHRYKAEEYGVPQMRHRIIIVGIDKRLNMKFKVPAPTTINKAKTAREAIEEPTIPKESANNELTRQSLTVVERLQYIKPWENAWTAKLPEHLKLNVKNAKLSQIYRRLHPDKPSYTITGSGGGGTHGYHWKEPRALTNRERARIQTFPDSFIFEGSKEKVRKQIGMAVPPLLSKIIFESILKTLSGAYYKSIHESYSLI
jgi:DNA (cytosine-5)-methyltransferase 1